MGVGRQVAINAVAVCDVVTALPGFVVAASSGDSKAFLTDLELSKKAVEAVALVAVVASLTNGKSLT